ncbi:MAG TPA: acyl carrier protein [Phycisphaerae bacterium]|nr:acyl carrier protein [Phycisphaerae bacterium]
MDVSTAVICELLRAVTEKDIHEEDVISESRYLEDLGLTSIQLVDLVMAIEERFNVEIEDVDLAKLRTVGQTVDYLKQKT